MAWTEQLTSGRYRGGYRIPSGQKRYTPATYAHKRAAEREAARLESDSRDLGWRDPRAAERTWGEWHDEWITSRVIEASTAKRDLSRIKNHLLPRWADTQLTEITRHDVKAWAADLLEDGYANATVNRIIALLSASLTAAADAEVIPANPALRLRLGLTENPSERTLAVDEQRLLFQAFDSDRDRALVALLLGTGGRWGEVIGLTAKRTDLDREEIRYRDAWDTANRILVAHTKGKKRRTVPHASWVGDYLRPLVEDTPRGFLFAGDGGDPIDYSSWHKRHWLPAIAASGLDDAMNDPVTIHTLRHTYATEQLEAGLSLAEIADLLGHNNIATTERYAHRRRRDNPIARTAIQDPRLAPDPVPAERPANVVEFRRR